jgi:hypothetical protein
MLTPKQDEILEGLCSDGSLEWHEVEEMFAGLELSEVEEKLNEIFPTENNNDFAELIFGEVG